MKEKPCKICGKMFVPDCPSNVICKEDHYQPCPVCGKKLLWNSTRKVEPCSRECSKQLTKQKNIAKYGVEHPMQSKEVQAHHKQAMLDKYGVESPLQSQEIRQKAIETNREKFGADWALGSKEIQAKSAATMTAKYGGPTPMQCPSIRKKIEEVFTEKYGVPYPFQSDQIQDKITTSNFLTYGVKSMMQLPEVLDKVKERRLLNNGGQYWTREMSEKMRQTSLQKYGVDNPSKSPEIKAKIKDTLIERYGEDYGSYLQRNISPSNVISNVNRAFASRLLENGLESEFEFSEISGYRYDIKIKGSNTLLEIDPTYTHNTIGNHWSDVGLDSNYHLDKTNAATAAGYRCIHVFDWDDWDRIIDIVRPKQPVYARECTIYKLQPKVADEFLNKYHLQGTVRKQIVCLGLVKDGELLQVMTFGEPRYNSKYQCELLRLCTKPGVAIVGGAERLFKFATKQLYIDSIISYCDLSKFKGDVYERIGMKLKEVTPPQEVWSKNDRKITSNLLRQRGFDQLFGTNYGKGTSNIELMLQDGWLPVYDCGQAVYTFD